MCGVCPTVFPARYVGQLLQKDLFPWPCLCPLILCCFKHMRLSRTGLLHQQNASHAHGCNPCICEVSSGNASRSAFIHLILVQPFQICIVGLFCWGCLLIFPYSIEECSLLICTFCNDNKIFMILISIMINYSIVVIHILMNTAFSIHNN